MKSEFVNKKKVYLDARKQGLSKEEARKAVKDALDNQKKRFYIELNHKKAYYGLPRRKKKKSN